jgi:hypothetical protein
MAAGATVTAKNSTPLPADPSSGNTSFAERRAARLVREAEHGPAPRRRTALRAGEDADNAVVIIDGPTIDESSPA